MRKKIIFNRLSIWITLIGICLTSNIMAQQQTVSGQVQDSSGTALVGVTVQLAGTKQASLTDKTGTFSIKAQTGDVLVFTHIGYISTQITVGSQLNYQITLQASADNNLKDVVVTAMDIKRNSRELGYSVQTIKGDDIQQTQRENFVNALQGRAAGVTINPTSGQAGASSQIVLRGFNSASLNNQPLFVVDGIIIDNTTFNETSNGGSGIGLADDRPNRTSDYANRISDINPSDIASITILKGPEATALYGSQASSGAIIITTKKPGMNGQVHVTYDNSFRFNKITRFPEVLDEYGQGKNGEATNIPSEAFLYFGPAYAAGTQKYDNISSFFRTGFANTQNVAADMGTKNVGFRLTGSYFNNSGVIPNNKYRRYNFKLSNNTKLWDGKLVISPSISYINSENLKPTRGAGGYILDLYAWPTIDDASNYQDAEGNKRLLYADDPNSEVLNNPFFSAYRNYGQDNVSRWIATLGIDLKPVDWLTIAGRFGYDTYDQDGYSLTDPQSSTLTAASQGFLSNYYLNYKGYNHTITATATKKVGKFGLRAMVGTMWQDYQTREFALAGSQLLDADNKLSHSTDSSNIGMVSSRLARNKEGLPNESITRQVAYFGEAAVSYNNVLFLSYTHRFEQASVFAPDKRSYNYPGISFSAILSDIIPGIKGNFLNYLKLRASRAQTARLMPPYLNQAVFVDNYASSDIPAYSYSYYNNNPNLVPEKQKTYEMGLETRLLDNRISLEAAYYNTHNLDQISVGYRASYGTGYILNTQNATESRNQGIEITMNINPVRKKDFNWDIEFNFNHMWSKVLDIPASIADKNDYYISDTWIYLNTRGGFVRGYPTTELTGYSFERSNNGQILISPETGMPVVNTSFSPIGDRNPDFTLGTNNTFRYKNWQLSFLWDLRVGGDIYNATEQYLTYMGKSQLTKDRMKSTVIEGVLQDGNENTANPTKNTISFVPNEVASTYYSETKGFPDEVFIQKDINAFRLRDITLTYQIPQTLIDKWKVFKSLSFFFTGNDLVLFTNYKGADPNVSGTTAGSVGVGGFGMDYGNVAAPVSYNFGLKANF